jgi:predicted KAP-like P-loop ATPase
VNFIDFVAIETLRVLCPDVYDGLRRNRGRFTGYKMDDGRQQESAMKGFYDGVTSTGGWVRNGGVGG